MSAASSFVILAYHSISPPQSAADGRLTTSPARFAEHLGWLVAEGFATLTLRQWWEERAHVPDRVALLTFDDGYQDFADCALPLLQQHQCAATVFAVTGQVGQFNDWQRGPHDPRRPLLNWPDLAALAHLGVEIGAHSHRHPYLDLIPLSQAREEILQSKALLEDQLARPITSFAYPYGYSTPAVRRLVAAAGFATACAVVNALNAPPPDPLALARLVMHDGVTVEQLRTVLQQGAPPPARRWLRQSLTAIYRPYRRLKSALAPS